MSINEKLAGVFSPVLSGADTGIIVSSPVNRRYLTGFESSDGFLLITAEDAAFYTDSRYTEAAGRAITVCRVEKLTDSDMQLPEFFKERGITKIFLEAQRLTVSELSHFSKIFTGTELITEGLDDCLTGARKVKSSEETEFILAAQHIAEDAFDYILGYAKPGMTEREVALELDYRMLRNGAQALSFETIAVSGANSSLPHGVPSDKKIENGDFLTLDFGAVYGGYHSDMTRTVIFGKPSAEQQKVYNTVLTAQASSLAVLKDGLSCFDADKAARDVITDAGYGDFFGHGTGHGVGLEIHEPVNLSPRSKDTLKAGHIVTVEPGIYLPGKFGVRIEDMALITENGCVNLTHCPKELICC